MNAEEIAIKAWKEACDVKPTMDAAGFSIVNRAAELGIVEGRRIQIEAAYKDTLVQDHFVEEGRRQLAKEILKRFDFHEDFGGLGLVTVTKSFLEETIKAAPQGDSESEGVSPPAEEGKP